MGWVDESGNAVTDPMLAQQLGAPPAGKWVDAQGTPVGDKGVLDRLGTPETAHADSQPGMNTPWWLNAIGGGTLPFGLAPRLQAATAAAKESLGGGLPFGEAYNQALPMYQHAAARGAEEHPAASTALNVAGSLPTMYLGSEAINAGLRALGPAGRFLAGEADIPSIARDASGRFRALTSTEEALNAGKQFASRLAMYAREGGQAGAFGAAQQGEDPLMGAGRGILMGTALGATVPLATSALGKLASVPAAIGDALPGWAKVGLSAAGGAGALEHAGQLTSMAAEHPLLAGGAAATAGTVAASRYLAEHPEFRDLLTRLGVLAYGPASAHSGYVVPGLPPSNQ